MSWKTFSLRKKSTPTSPEKLSRAELAQSLKRGDEKRIMLMNLVKDGKLTVEDAMRKAYGMGVASVPYEELDDNGTEVQGVKHSGAEVLNFGVYKYGKSNKSLKCVLQLDCQEDILSLIHRGQKQKSYTFSSIKGAEGGDDSTRFFIRIDDASEMELDADSFEDKNMIMRLLMMIIGQSQHGITIDQKMLSVQEKTVIKEGLLEKRGHSAAFLVWTKRFLRIMPGELMYFKSGEEENDGNALSMIGLSPHSTFVRKVDHNGFLLITNKKEYAFRVIGSKGASEIEKDRDDWIIAIQEASRKISTLSMEASEPVSPSSQAHQQESYLKHIVKTLQEELEQLGVILNIIDAPIRASTQVKKVREIVQSLNEQVHTGLLSWTIRSSAQQHRLREGPGESPPVSPRSPHGPKLSSNWWQSRSMDDYYNTVPFNGSAKQTSPGKFSASLPGHSSQRSTPQYGSYSKLQGSHSTRVLAQHAPDAYHMLRTHDFPQHVTYDPENWNKLSFQKIHSENSTSSLSDIKTSLHDGDPGARAISSQSSYAMVNKTYTGRSRSLENLTEQNEDEPPPVPPKLEYEMHTYSTKPTGRDNVYVPHKLQPKPESFCSNSKENAVPGTTLKLDLSFKPVETKDRSASLPILPTLPPGAPPPPPPPPPPGVSFAQSMLPPKAVIKPGRKMKPLFWSKVPDVLVSSSVWIDAKDRSEVFSFEKLEELFGAAVDLPAKAPQAEPSAQTTKTLLDPKKAQNFGIFLSGFKVDVKDLESKLSALDEHNGLDADQVVALKRFQPSSEEIELYKSYKGDSTRLAYVDQFMMKLCDIPNLSGRLDILLTVLELPDLYQEVSSATNVILNACRSITENADFERLLEYILTVGNYMNGSTNRGGAYGFKLAALSKLVDIRSADKKHTLLQFIVEHLIDTDPSAIYCFEQMDQLLQPMDMSMKALIGEVEVMRKDLTKVGKTIQLFDPNDGASNAAFVHGVDGFVDSYSGHLSDLESRCGKLREYATALKKRYGEASSTDFQEWLNHVSIFLKQLQRTVENVEGKRRRASKRNESLSQPKKITNQVVQQDDEKVLGHPMLIAAGPTLDESLSAGCDPVTKPSLVAVTPVSPFSGLKEHAVPKDNGSLDIGYDSTNNIKADSYGIVSAVPLKVYEAKHAALLKRESTHVYNNPVTSISLMPADIDDDDNEIPFPTKSGYMDKLSGGNRRPAKWDRRFFEVTNAGYLHYSKKEAGKLSGSIYLRGLPLEWASNDAKVIILKQVDREWKLRADSEQEAHAWFNVLAYYVHREELSI